MFGKHIGLRDAVIVGGIGESTLVLEAAAPPHTHMHSHIYYYFAYIDMMKQSLVLARKPHVVIATPGRLADHLKSTDTVSLKKIKFLVSQ